MKTFFKRHEFKYVISITLVYVILFLLTNIFDNEVSKNSLGIHDIEKRVINKESEDYIVKVNYPKIGNSTINNDIRKFIYDYTKVFISESSEKSLLNIDYEIYFSDTVLNIFFTIDNSRNKALYYKSFNYNILNNEEVMEYTDTDSYDIDTWFTKKYSSSMSERFKSIDKENYAFKLTDKGIHYYFNYDLFDNITYTPELYFDYNKELIITPSEKPYKVAFTFDDGPSEYTNSLVDALKLNNAKATFFMLGNRMKYKQSVVLNVFNNGMEIGSHSYSHKNLNKISESEIQKEVNSSTIIFNEITGSNIELFRPPYGNVNAKAKANIPFAIITWNVDTEDWLHRDAARTYNHILENVCDGCIILMHDVYPETLEAVKMVLPQLDSMGYEVTTVSNLAESKNITLIPGNIYRSFHNYNLPF